MWAVKDGYHSLTGASRGGPRGSGAGAGGRILADFIAHFFGHITQAVRKGLALPETLNTTVQKANPAEQQVRTVPQRHDDGGDGCKWQSDDMTPRSSLFALGPHLSNGTKTKFLDVKHKSSSHAQGVAFKLSHRESKGESVSKVPMDAVVNQSSIRGS